MEHTSQIPQQRSHRRLYWTLGIVVGIILIVGLYLMGISWVSVSSTTVKPGGTITLTEHYLVRRSSDVMADKIRITDSHGQNVMKTVGLFLGESGVTLPTGTATEAQLSDITAAYMGHLDTASGFIENSSFQGLSSMVIHQQRAFLIDTLGCSVGLAARSREWSASQSQTLYVFPGTPKGIYTIDMGSAYCDGGPAGKIRITVQ